MDRQTAISLRIGAWRVDPTAGEMSREGQTVRVEARTMRLLLCLAQHAGEVVSVDELLNQVWAGVIVTPDSVYQAVTALRRLLGDDARRPTYIANVPRLGYRLIAPVSPWVDEPTAFTTLAPAVAASPQFTTASVTSPPLAPSVEAASDMATAGSNEPRSRASARVKWGAGIALAVALITGLIFVFARMNDPAAPARSVAVLPFLDLTTQEMNEEYFADGMTEELIDRLSRVPGLHVPAPTASFYFKGKQVALADAAKALGVTYVLDGSIRKTGGTLRIAVRLVRGDDGYVIWSETYDRPEEDRLKIQDDIASRATQALNASIR